jgi:hypothetical protein
MMIPMLPIMKVDLHAEVAVDNVETDKQSVHLVGVDDNDHYGFDYGGGGGDNDDDDELDEDLLNKFPIDFGKI